MTSDDVMVGRKRKHADAPLHTKKAAKTVDVLRPATETFSVQVPAMERPRRHTRVPKRYGEFVPTMLIPASQSDDDEDYIPDTSAVNDIDLSEEQDCENRHLEKSEVTTTTKSSTPSRPAFKLSMPPGLQKILTEKDRLTIEHGVLSGLSTAAIVRTMGLKKGIEKSYGKSFHHEVSDCAFPAHRNRPKYYHNSSGKRRRVGATDYPEPRLDPTQRALPILEKFGERSSIDIKASTGDSVIVSCDYLVQTPFCFVVDSARCLVNMTPWTLCREGPEKNECKYPWPYGVSDYNIAAVPDKFSADIMSGNYVFDA